MFSAFKGEYFENKRWWKGFSLKLQSGMEAGILNSCNLVGQHQPPAGMAGDCLFTWGHGTNRSVQKRGLSCE
jgi:hypothetical protein